MLKNTHTNNKEVEKVIERRYNILIIIIVILIMILFIKLFYIQIIKRNYYLKQLKEVTNLKIEGSTAPRGRIYDRNNKLIVDNKPVKIIYYEKGKNSIDEEIELAYKLSKIINVENKSTNRMYKTFWMLKYPNEANKKITKEEIDLLNKRKITNKEIIKYKYDRITSNDLEKLTDSDKNAAYIYDLMNRGYRYQEKIIKKDNVTDSEYASVAANLKKLKGINVRLDWERVYLYNDTFKSIIGTISDNSIPSDLEDYYLSKGYNLNDRVGVSYLEYQYDKYLRGEKNIYKIYNHGEKVLTKLGKKGNDIKLTIDIELQKELENILEEEIKKTKKEPNTDYYNRSFVIITNPKTGEILAMAGKQIKEDSKKYQIYDYTPGIMTSPITAGSVVKGASHIVGYNNKALSIGEIRIDRCVKLSGTKTKCSWMPLGTLNDITALKKSSNTYQYYTALKVANTKYYYNTVVKDTSKALTTYRKTFNEFGLGSKTGIDLPIESTGNVGTKNTGGLLLDFSIGQYDTYTPLELSQYIGTIANDGRRMKLHLLKSHYKNKKEILYKNKELNKVKTEEKYMKRVQLGFREVLKYGGTGSGYIDLKYKPAGKTGTSQSFVDTNGDGRVDKETITTTFASYAPYDDPIVTFTIVSPDISNYDHFSSYQSNINSRIMRRISKLYFDKFNS